MRPITLDFETLPIKTRPHYPPKPVSFSLKLPSWKEPKFYAWGHLTGKNNCSVEDAKHALTQAYAAVSETTPLLCHNAKFDLDVAEEHFGLSLPTWRNFHDTMFLLFLDDPHQRSLGLKQSAERIFGLPPDEKDAVKDWILEHKKQLEQDFPEIVTEYGGIKPSTAGAFIAFAPGNIVKPYANGDVTRTEKIFKAKYKEITFERGMGEAYDRERRLLPVLLRNEREGIRVDTSALARDQEVYEKAQTKTDAWLRKALKAPTLDLNKDAEVAKALDEANMITEWSLTATGRKSVSKKNMKLSHFRDRKVAAAYSYRQKCATVLETFIRPWQRFTVNGTMHTTWNQVRQAKGDDTGGTRTGRPSTDTPNFLNMPREVKDNVGKSIEDIDAAGFLMPTHIKDLPPLPKVRGYILPDAKKHVVGKRDFDQQELRVLAHFEDGMLLQAYLDNPKLDVHQFVKDQIKLLAAMDVDRSFTKTLNFGYVYGQGTGSLAERLNKTVEEVRSVRDAQMKALPGLKNLSTAIKSRAKQGDCITTWGGRQYYCEPPMIINGRLQSFEYKLLNYLVQGSSADITKEALIRYDEARKDGRLMLTVYDEVDIDVPEKAAKREMLLLREVMLSIELDVPLLSEGKVGQNLGEMEKLNEPDADLSRWVGS